MTIFAILLTHPNIYSKLFKFSIYFKNTIFSFKLLFKVINYFIILLKKVSLSQIYKLIFFYYYLKLIYLLKFTSQLFVKVFFINV
jgi:hypothetical protein